MRGSVALSFVVAATSALAHVPHIERSDYSGQAPARISDVRQSLAFYGHLSSGSDVDVMTFRTTGPTRLKIEFLVPACSAYANFYPRFAIVGPGLPAAPAGFPLAVPPGQGAVVIDNPVIAGARPTMYEPFGGKSYYECPGLDVTLPRGGSWSIVVWSPQGYAGDYVLAPGYVERFAGIDLIRTLVNTKLIRADGELHSPCAFPP